jgi:hypothetical protein
VGCSTATTAGGTNVCSAACQLAVAGTGARRDRRRRRVGASIIRFYILFSFLYYVNYVFMFKKAKSKNAPCRWSHPTIDYLKRRKQTRVDILDVQMRRSVLQGLTRRRKRRELEGKESS